MMSSVPVVAVLAAFCLLMLGVQTLQVRRIVGPEIGRKLVHVGMGIIALSFPWVFRDALLVWLLAAISLAMLGAVRLMPSVATRFGQILGGVERTSLGEFFFPLGVAIAFTLADGNAGAYCGAVGVLAFADSAGALVGTRWGCRRYSIVGNRKSFEGSAAVLATSSLWIAIVCVSLEASTWTAGLKVGLMAGSVATLVEAVFSYGLDNLVLPLVVVELMKQ
jgi:phytol kinase